jgi:hypothetical protein
LGDFSSADEFDVFIDEVEASFEVADKSDEVFAEFLQAAGDATAELPEGQLKFFVIGGLDDAEDGFGLEQIDASMQEGTEREFAAPCHSYTVLEEFFEHGFEDGFTAGNVEFGEDFSGEAAASGPEAQGGRNGGFDSSSADEAWEASWELCVSPCISFAVFPEHGGHGSYCAWSANPDNASFGTAGGGS